jgi:hypothetical protein
MTNEEAVGLITGGISKTGKPQKWADLGCGDGTFTEALASILPHGSQILAVDKEVQHLKKVMGNNVSVDFLHEYDTLRANPWVPYPIDFIRLREFFMGLNYDVIDKLSERKSIYGRANIYAASVV